MIQLQDRQSQETSEASLAGRPSQPAQSDLLIPHSEETASMAGPKRKHGDVPDSETDAPRVKRSRTSRNSTPQPGEQMGQTSQHAEIEDSAAEVPRTPKQVWVEDGMSHGVDGPPSVETGLDNAMAPVVDNATTHHEAEGLRSSPLSELSEYDEAVITAYELGQPGPFSSDEPVAVPEDTDAEATSMEALAHGAQDTGSLEDATHTDTFGDASYATAKSSAESPETATDRHSEAVNSETSQTLDEASPAKMASAKRTSAARSKKTAAGDAARLKTPENRTLSGRISKPVSRPGMVPTTQIKAPLPADENEDDDHGLETVNIMSKTKLSRRSSCTSKKSKAKAEISKEVKAPASKLRKTNTTPVGDDTPGAPKRKTIFRGIGPSCLQCLRAHIGCSRKRPACDRCEKKNLQCVYESKPGRESGAWKPADPLQRRQKGSDTKEKEPAPKEKATKEKISAAPAGAEKRLGPSAMPPPDVEIFQMDPNMLELSHALTQHRNVPTVDKPQPKLEPRVWADSRQSLIETLPFFKKPQGGCHANDSHVYAFLFDGIGHCREHMDTDLVIARAGGSMESDSSGSMVQGKDQSMSEAQAKAVLNDIQLQNPVIIICGDKNVGSPVKMPHKYCVLGWYKPTMVWTEKTAGKGKKAYNTVKYRFERLGGDSNSEVWHAPRERHDVPFTQQVGPMERKACIICHQESSRIYLEGWFCLNSECASFWKVDGRSAPTGAMNYDPAFLLHRTQWATEAEPYDVRIPPPDFGKTIGSHLSYINTRGIVCPECGRCNPRYRFKGWVCDNANQKCNWKLDANHPPITQTALHQPWDTFGDGPSLARNKHEACVKVEVTSAHGYKVYTYTVDGIKGKLVHAVSNKSINQEPDGPDQMFEELQIKDMGLERRRFKVEKGSGPKDKSPRLVKAASSQLTKPVKVSSEQIQLPTPPTEPQNMPRLSSSQDNQPMQADEVEEAYAHGLKSGEDHSLRTQYHDFSAPDARVLFSVERPNAEDASPFPKSTDTNADVDTEAHAEAEENGGAAAIKATDGPSLMDTEVSSNTYVDMEAQETRIGGSVDSSPAHAQNQEGHDPAAQRSSVVAEVHMEIETEQADVRAHSSAAIVQDQGGTDNESRSTETIIQADTEPIDTHDLQNSPGDHTSSEDAVMAQHAAEANTRADTEAETEAQTEKTLDLATEGAAELEMKGKAVGVIEPSQSSAAVSQTDEGQVETGDFMTAFSVNYGMPYKFVAGGASRSFENAPRAARACRSRLQWAARNLMKDPEGNTNFNEELIFAYLEGQKIEYHDDGEEGLGPCITTLSLGGSAKMSMRMKAKYYFGCSKTGVFNQERPVPGSVNYEQRLQAWDELQTITDKAEYNRRLKTLPKELGIYADRSKKAGDLVTITLNHGDIVVMDGYDIQKYLEHKVAPEGYLRFAMTCRTVLGNHLKPEELPPYEVREDDFGYDGSNLPKA